MCHYPGGKFVVFLYCCLLSTTRCLSGSSGIGRRSTYYHIDLWVQQAERRSGNTGAATNTNKASDTTTLVSVPSWCIAKSIPNHLAAMAHPFREQASGDTPVQRKRPPGVEGRC